MTIVASRLEGSHSGLRTFSIQELLRLATVGSLRIPRLQQPFAWDAADVRMLFDSLYRGFPVGTLLLWQQTAPAEHLDFGGVEVDAPQTSDALLVVDGQQRLTSLIASLAPHPQHRDDRFEVFFDPARHRFVGLNEGMVPPNSIPVREVLDSRSLLTWVRQHGDTIDDGDLDAADELARALRDYQVLAYVVEGDDEHLLREVFDRINTAGKPRTRAQVFHALLAPDTDLGSPATVVASLRRLGFGDLPEDVIIQSLLAIRGGDVQREIGDEFGPDEDSADWYEQTQRALDRAIRFLKADGVPHQVLMPTSLPLPVLAAFFHLHPEPEAAMQRLLERWLWRGWVHGFGCDGDQTLALRRAVQSVNPTRGRPESAPKEYTAVKALLDDVRDTRVDDLQLAKLRSDDSWQRLVLLTLNSLHPLESGALGGRGAPDDDDVEAAIARLRAGDLPALPLELGRNLTQLTMERLNSKIAPGRRTIPPLSSLLIPDPRDDEVPSG